MKFEPIENGIVLIDKPVGLTSFGVVARVRSKLKQVYGHKIKVGHTGTLDPFASGLLILVIGSECKQASKYSGLDKTYEAEIILGKKSSTGDVEGEISNISNVKPSPDAIKEALFRFVGEIEQTPPKFSAIKIDGRRAYDLARQGKNFIVPSRRVTVRYIELISYNYPSLKIRTRVSSGTYIRTLAEDIGESLGTGAYCKSLRRTSVGDWLVSEASSLE